MLVGTTFAWFTDSVTSAGNKIMSGSLKVVLEVWNTEDGKFE
jgi:predicted ribosomally synthesized peptide with SipW-like signal peptide